MGLRLVGVVLAWINVGIPRECVGGAALLRNAVRFGIHRVGRGLSYASAHYRECKEASV